MSVDEAMVGFGGAAQTTDRPRVSSVATDQSGRYDSLIQPGQAEAPERQDYMPAEVAAPGQVFDAAAYRALELDDLFECLDTTQLTLGQCALQRSLTSPPTDPAGVRARQDALLEIEGSPGLRKRLQTLVESCIYGEQALFDLIWAEFNGPLGLGSAGDRPREGFGYEAFKATRRLFNRLIAFTGETPRSSFGPIGRLILSIFPISPAAAEAARTAEAPARNAFLNGLFEDLRQLRDSRSHRLLTQGIVTESGPKTRDEMPWYGLGYRFRPTFFKPLLILAFGLMAAVGVEYYSEIYGNFSSHAASPALGLFALSAVIPVLAIYFFLVGTAERDSFMKPVGEVIGSDPVALRALDALGEIDALLALARFRERFPAATCMPEILLEKQHSLKVKGVRNPVITIEEHSYVANDAELEKARLSFITGPNSGGKTALCKTVLQCQALAQMGSYIPAEAASVAPADRIFYQIPQPGQLERHEGRFATELSRTRDIFFACTPMSLTVLDEPFEGTSFEERLSVSRQVLDGFIKLGASTIFITHNHALARSYRRKGGGKSQFLMTDFDGDRPTYRFKKGIASRSHAESVAKEIGFGKEDIDKRFESQE